MQSKNILLEQLLAQGKAREIVTILKKQKRFEMKFDNVSSLTSSFYKEIITAFLKTNCRYTAMIIDTHHPNFNRNTVETTWDAYTSHIATIVTEELINFVDENIVLILDELSKPRAAKLSLEDIVLTKIYSQLAQKTHRHPFSLGATRVESHSSLLLQLCDILLGAIMYDIKKDKQLFSQKLISRKDEVVDTLRQGLGKTSLTGSYILTSPLYFNVWEILNHNNYK